MRVRRRTFSVCTGLDLSIRWTFTVTRIYHDGKEIKRFDCSHPDSYADWPGRIPFDGRSVSPAMFGRE